MMVSASLEETQPMMTSSTWEGGEGEGGGDGVHVVGGDPANDDVKYLGGGGGGGGAVMVSASLEETQPKMTSSTWEGGGGGGGR